MPKLLRNVCFAALFLIVRCAAFSGTFYIAAKGSDTNNGTSESTPWSHAPGMPNCTDACAAHVPVAGDRFIFRGGETWHFGNIHATPYTGGTWSWSWSGTSTNCDSSDNPNAARSSCIYVGVDPTWYSGTSWTRPIMTGDNPPSQMPVARCANGNVGRKNQFLLVHNEAYAWFDNFEWTGMCQSTASAPSNNYLFQWNTYIVDIGGSAKIVQNIYSNMYAHGWTHLSYSCSDTGGEPTGQCESDTFITGGLMSTVGPGNVCDGWDSDPTGVVCIAYGPGYLVYDNVFANMSQIVVNGYHSWHDNYWYNYFPSGDGVAHGNSFEANSDAPAKDSNGFIQPDVPFNVFYNNILGHNAPGTSGDVKLWFCPNATAAEYQFDNVVYDQGRGNNWDFAQNGFNCTTSNAGVYFFNNTVDLPGGTAISCPSNGTMTNNHIITESGTGFNNGSCTIYNNTVMNHATAVAQGYMAAGAGTSGNNNNTTCADDNIPCAPRLPSNTTVGAGTSVQNYCDSLLGSNDGIVVRAGKACQSGTNDNCAYNAKSHTVICLHLASLARMSKWDTGRYQYDGQTGTVAQSVSVAQSSESSNCSVKETNADYSADNGSANTASVTANISAAGDLIAITAWCYSSCTPASVQLGSQSAAATTVAGNPGPGNPGTGQGYIYYVLSAMTAGPQTLTFTAKGSHTDIQTSYVDFTPSSGCTFKHDLDYLVGSGTGGTANTPVISPNAGDLLFNFTYTSEHIDSVNSPWNCPIYNQPGESLTCEFVNTINAAAYILSAPSSSIANNMTLIHSSDSWQTLVTSFAMSGNPQNPSPPVSLNGILH